MFGWRLISDREIALQSQITALKIESLTSELHATKAYVEKCEALIAHERSRIDSERERADRIADSLFQEKGLPATSTTVLNEQRSVESAADAKRTKQMEDLLEIYGETEQELLEDGAEPLPQEVAEIAQ
jgi:hypothetical protein